MGTFRNYLPMKARGTDKLSDIVLPILFGCLRVL